MTKNIFLQKVSEEVYRNSKIAGNIVPINENGITYGESLPSKENAKKDQMVKNTAYNP